MLVLNTWLSATNKENEAERSREVFGMLADSLPETLSDLSTSRCYICGATPKKMNDLNKCLNKVPDASKFEFGLSPLGGSGTSNDGNSARNFFHNSEISAEITGIRKDLLDRCSHLLQSLSSGYKINSQKFKSYAFDTAKMLIEEYPWYNLPSSIHKILMHGSEVIDNSILSIGELSEEAAESCNKLVKLYAITLGNIHEK